VGSERRQEKEKEKGHKKVDMSKNRKIFPGYTPSFKAPLCCFLLCVYLMHKKKKKEKCIKSTINKEEREKPT